MSDQNNSGNGRGYIRSGSAADMMFAYVFRAASMVAQGVAVLLLWALLNMAITIRDDTRDLKKEWPEMKQSVASMKEDIAALKRQGETFATKRELEAEANRVTTEFRRLLDDQMKKARDQQTKENMNYAR